MEHSTPILLADVGGTHTRCAHSDGQKVGNIEVFDNHNFASIESILVDYIGRYKLTPSQVLLGVAGLVKDGQVNLLNHNWRFSEDSVRQATGTPVARLVNDFEALAYALPFLSSDEIRKLGGQSPDERATKAVLGPGTGLGVSGLVYTKPRWVALSGEGGHVTLAATNEREEALCRYLRDCFGRASAERALSGAGLSGLFHFLTERREPAATISKMAAAGNTEAVECFELFFGLLASVAGDLALTLGATGGVYVGGGILQKNLGLLNQTEFRRCFEDKGRYRYYLESIPVFLITSQTPAFAGLRYLSTMSDS